MTRPLPPTASIAEMDEDGRLFAPSAARNRDVLASVVQRFAPAQGRALELASGTGQHVVAFASACPNLIWVPTEIDPERRASISAYVQEAQLTNLSFPVHLDAAAPGWSATTGAVDFIVLVNLLHLISAPEAETVIQETCAALAPRGRALFYGPFTRGGALTSEGDARFHASLCEADPAIGYKDDADVARWFEQAGAPVTQIIEMPANNLVFVCEKPE